MVSATEIRQIAQTWRLPEQTIEKDYVLGWVLWGIANHPLLSRKWVFRGGTCLKKCYVNTHRYSEDLDFTVLPDGPWQPAELEPLIAEVLAKVGELTAIDFQAQAARFELLPHGRSSQGRVYYRGPRGTPNPIAIKLDIVATEPVVRPPVLKTIGHPYSDVLPEPNQVYCYNLEELFAEKIRAMLERCRPRDLYDIVYLFRRSDINAEAELIQLVLQDKCAAKSISIPSYSELAESNCRREIQDSWSDMLGHQLGVLPSFDDYWVGLATLMAWLNDEDVPDNLPLIPVAEDEAWAPAPVVWERGHTDQLEPVRFAAVNRLCIALGYGRSVRPVEPYSLRRTRAGHILLYGLKADSGELRAYRVDRIESIEVTSRPFTPRAQIEFLPDGSLPIPPTARRWGTRTRMRRNIGGLVYIVECSYCHKQFRRAKLDLNLRPHKQEGPDWDCPGRHGYLVETTVE